MKKYIILATILQIGCVNESVKPHVTPVPIDSDVMMCAMAEQNLQKLCDSNSTKNAYCCKVVKKTKKGKSYTQFCAEKQLEGIFLNPKCLSEIKSCDLIDKCTQSK